MTQDSDPVNTLVREAGDTYTRLPSLSLCVCVCVCVCAGDLGEKHNFQFLHPWKLGENFLTDSYPPVRD